MKNEKELRYINAEKQKSKRLQSLNTIKVTKSGKNKSQDKLLKVKIQETIKENKMIELKIKKEKFKIIKNLEKQFQDKSKENETQKKIIIENNIKIKISDLEKDFDNFQEKINNFENEELEILKRMNKSSSLLASSKLFFSFSFNIIFLISECLFE